MIDLNYPQGQPLRPHSIRLEIFEDEETTGLAAARLVAEQIGQQPASVLLLPTGRTPLIMYQRLVEQLRQRDLSRLRTFNLDEFYGLAADHSGSYHTYMRQVLFAPLGLAPAQTRLLDGLATDPVAEGRAYEEAIEAAGGIDLAVLGIGANGHIGFNEPGSELDSRTRLVAIQPQTRAANAFLFDNRLENVPASALTVGIGTILAARRILLIATGPTKAAAVGGMLNGPISAQLPASFLRLHPAVILLADKTAANF